LKNFSILQSSTGDPRKNFKYLRAR